MPADNDILNLAQVAQMLGVEDATVRYWIKKGELPADKPGRNWEIKRSDAQALAAKRRSKWASDAPEETQDFEAPQRNASSAAFNFAKKAST